MIVVELMERKLEEGLHKVDAASFAYSSTAFPMLTGTLITTAGFIPVGFAASTAGEYVRSLFFVVGIALIVSWFAAVYFTPWLGNMILKQRAHAGDHHDVFDTRFYRGLRGTVGWAVRHRIIVLALTIMTFVTSLWAFQFIPQNFFPQSSRPEILVDMWLPEGTSIKEVESQAKALEAKFGEPRKAALTWKPQNNLAVDDEQGEKLLRLIEALEENDDVQNVYANFEVSDALVSKMSA